MTDSCGKIKTVIIRTDVKAPYINIGNDTTICYGNTLKLNSKVTGGTSPYLYRWYPASMVDNNSLEEPTTKPLFEPQEYILKVTDILGCIDFDTILVSIDPLLYSEPASDMYICHGSGVKLRINIKGGTEPYKYHWEPKESLDLDNIESPLANPLEDTKYYARVKDKFGCEIIDSIFVHVYPELIVSAGSDLLVCPDSIIKFNATKINGVSGIKSYLWTPAAGLVDPSIQEPTLKISIPGVYNYIVTVTDDNGCIDRDTIQVNVIQKPKPMILGDKYICEGGSTILSIKKDTSFVEYLWSTGETDSAITIDKQGKYWVEVTNKAGCTGTDTIEVKYYYKTKPGLKLSGSPELCQGNSLTISVNEKYSDILWSNGSTDDSIIVNTPGNYFVKIIDNNGCTGYSDTINVTVVDSLKPLLEAENNGILCKGKSIKLSTKYNYLKYLWSTGETTKEITVTQPGFYKVYVEDGNCKGTSDEFEIKQVEPPHPQITGNSFICPGSTSILLVQRDYVSYKWTTGEETKEITIDKAGTYSVTVTDSNGCEGSSSIDVMEYDIKISGNNSYNFGKFNIGSTNVPVYAFNIKNESNSDVEVLNGYARNYPNIYRIVTNPSLPHTFKPNELLDITISFNPDEVKIYNDSLIIETGNPCKNIFSSFITGEGIKADLFSKVWLPDTVAEIGTDYFKIPLRSNFQIDTAITNIGYNTEIRFDARYFEPDSVTTGNLDKNVIESGERVLQISGTAANLTKNETILTEISGTVLVGASPIIPLKITDFRFDIPEIQIEKIDGSLKVTGVCVHDLNALIISGSTFLIIQPNPAKETIVFEFTNLDTSTRTTVQIFSLPGELVYESKFLNDGSRKEIDVSRWSSGMYFAVIKCGGMVYTDKIIKL